MLTGEQRVLRCDILFDCGRSINPALDMGQVCSGHLTMHVPVVSPGADNFFHSLLTEDEHAPLQLGSHRGCSAIWPPWEAMSMLYWPLQCGGYLYVSALCPHRQAYDESFLLRGGKICMLHRAHAELLLQCS